MADAKISRAKYKKLLATRLLAAEKMLADGDPRIDLKEFNNLARLYRDAAFPKEKPKPRGRHAKKQRVESQEQPIDAELHELVLKTERQRAELTQKRAEAEKRDAAKPPSPSNILDLIKPPNAPDAVPVPRHSLKADWDSLDVQPIARDDRRSVLIGTDHIDVTEQPRQRLTRAANTSQHSIVADFDPASDR